MAKGGRRGLLKGCCLALAYALLCLLAAGFSTFVLSQFSRPALLALHRLTAPIPFPLAEGLVYALALLLSAAMASAVFRALKARRFAPVARMLKGAAWVTLALIGALELLWLPALLERVEAPPIPETGQLEWLCGELIDALNASPLAFSGPAESLRLAPEAAGLTGGAVKAARYPEWMRAAGVSGLFVPLTGEAIVDGTAPAPLIPFTAVHELMHLSGVADEGAANIAAWERCLDYGGPFADSARLWALRYAMGLLRRADGAAWQRAADKMKDPLSQVFWASGGEILPTAASPRFPRLAPARGDYAALAGWLAAKNESTSSGPSGHLPLKGKAFGEIRIASNCLPLEGKVVERSETG